MTSDIDVYPDLLERKTINDIPKILIVEDDECCVMLIKEYLSDQSYLLTTAKNGEEAIKSCDSNDYDLVLLDIQLPKIDGYQVAKHLRQTNNKLPLIAVTATATNHKTIKDCGIDFLIEKPISYERLISTIKHFVN